MIYNTRNRSKERKKERKKEKKSGGKERSVLMLLQE